MKSIANNKIKNPFLLFFTLCSLSACNLYGKLDGPDGDPQILEAARACMNEGDYACAQERYAQLSTGENDRKIMEGIFAGLGNTKLFTFKDLLSNLGSGRGGETTLTGLAAIMASKGLTAASYRTSLQSQYQEAASIQNASLRHFTRTMVALVMFNQVLASGVGADGKFTASDLVTNASACRSENCSSSQVHCVKPAESSLEDTDSDTSISLNSASGWNGLASLNKVIGAIGAANDSINALTGNTSNSGVFDTFNQLQNQIDGLPGAGAILNCGRRQAILEVLFPSSNN